MAGRDDRGPAGDIIGPLPYLASIRVVLVAYAGKVQGCCDVAVKCGREKKENKKGRKERKKRKGQCARTKCVIDVLSRYSSIVRVLLLFVRSFFAQTFLSDGAFDINRFNNAQNS